MSRDSSFTPLHLHAAHHADLLETFTHPTLSALQPEEIYIPPHLQPLNPEDEDDVVPDQHAAFGIQRATQKSREVLWRDLGLEEVVLSGGREGTGDGPGGSRGGGTNMGAGSRFGGGGSGVGEQAATQAARHTCTIQQAGDSVPI